VVVADDRRQPERQQKEQDRAEHRPGMAAGAADDHHEQQQEGVVQAEDRRVHRVVDERVDHARDAGEHARQREHDDLDARDIDAHRGGGLGIVAYRAAGTPEPRALEAPQQSERGIQQRHDHDRVGRAGDAPAENRRQAVVGDAARAARDRAALVQDDDEELRERERHQREVEALEPRRRDRDGQREQRAHQHAQDGGHRERQADLEQQDHDAVGADAVEGEMREGHLPADAEQEVVAERERDPEQELAVDIVVIAAEEERSRGERREQRDPAEPPHAARARSRPVGRTSRNTMRNRSGTPCA
jgi:hypothetical protein